MSFGRLGSYVGSFGSGHQPMLHVYDRITKSSVQTPASFDPRLEYFEYPNPSHERILAHVLGVDLLTVLPDTAFERHVVRGVT